MTDQGPRPPARHQRQRFPEPSNGASASSWTGAVSSARRRENQGVAAAPTITHSTSRLRYAVTGDVVERPSAGSFVMNVAVITSGSACSSTRPTPRATVVSGTDLAFGASTASTSSATRRSGAQMATALRLRQRRQPLPAPGPPDRPALATPAARPPRRPSPLRENVMSMITAGVPVRRTPRRSPRRDR